MIELSGIGVRFETPAGALDAVRDVSLRIEQGEIFGIVGASGAGKSTLVRVINLLERPTRGTVRIEGVDVTAFRGARLRAVRRGIGMVFQHFNLLHARTVSDNVALPLTIAGVPRGRARGRVLELLQLVGLQDKAAAYPAQLSGGQKQRVGIARALANSPRIVLCDEPTSALDVESTQAILDLLRGVQRKLGITVVVITHEMAVVKAICDRVAVMSRGEVVELGTVYETFAHPRHEFTRQLVARTLDLEIPARLLDGSRGRVLRIAYRGEQAEEPVISEASRRFGVRVNILHGRIEYIGGHPLGTLVAGVDGAAGDVEAAVEYIRGNASEVEVLHG
jgi:D-methionine transport system ATP-binding protein